MSAQYWTFQASNNDTLCVLCTPNVFHYCNSKSTRMTTVQHLLGLSLHLTLSCLVSTHPCNTEVCINSVLSLYFFCLPVWRSWSCFSNFSGTAETPVCNCSRDNEIVSHLLLHCSRYTDAIQQMTYSSTNSGHTTLGKVNYYCSTMWQQHIC